MALWQSKAYRRFSSINLSGIVSTSQIVDLVQQFVVRHHDMVVVQILHAVGRGSLDNTGLLAVVEVVELYLVTFRAADLQVFGKVIAVGSHKNLNAVLLQFQKNFSHQGKQFRIQIGLRLIPNQDRTRLQ